MKLLGRVFKSPETWRYLVSAIATTLTDLGVFSVIHRFIQEQVSYVISFGVAVCMRFVIDRYWTFKGHSQESVGRQFITYWLLALFNLFLGAVLFSGLRWVGLPPILAKISSIPPTTVFAYLGLKFWVFGRRKKSVQVDPAEETRIRRFQRKSRSVYF